MTNATMARARPPDSVSLSPLARTLLSWFLAGAAVTLDAVLEVSNAFLQVLRPHLVRPVFMAPVAGVAAVVAARVRA
jgi:hypothetical protein